jgi:hypothetical protein
LVAFQILVPLSALSRAVPGGFKTLKFEVLDMSRDVLDSLHLSQRGASHQDLSTTKTEKGRKKREEKKEQVCK